MRWTEAGLTIAVAGLAGALGQNPRPTPPQARARPFVVVLDAAHGGSDEGARLGKNLLEKTVTLSVAEHLQALLRQQGIVAMMTRTADIDMPTLNRAEMENHAQAAVCLVIHATATGSGVHLFTSSLVAPQPGSNSSAATPGMLPWATAQAAAIGDSLKLESELDAALVHAEVPVTMGRASVAPMDHLTCAAVAVELAPLAPGNTTKGRAITDEQYQKTVEGALAAGIGSWRIDRKQQ